MYALPLSSAFVGCIGGTNFDSIFELTLANTTEQPLWLVDQLSRPALSPVHLKSTKKCSMRLLHPHLEASCWKKENSFPSQINILPSALLSQTLQHLLQDHDLPTPLDYTPQRTASQTLYVHTSWMRGGGGGGNSNPPSPGPPSILLPNSPAPSNHMPTLDPLLLFAQAVQVLTRVA